MEVLIVCDFTRFESFPRWWMANGKARGWVEDEGLTVRRCSGSKEVFLGD